MKKNKKFKNIILIVIITIIMLIIISTIRNFETYNLRKELNYINSEKIYKELYFPNGLDLFMNEYYGELRQSNIAKSMNYVIMLKLPEYYKCLREYSDNEIYEYYEENKEKIKIVLGISNKKEFLLLIKKLKESELDELEEAKYYIDVDTIQKKKMFTQAKVWINYKNGITISITINVKNFFVEDASSIIYGS